MSDFVIDDTSATPDKPERPRLDAAEIRSDMRADERSDFERKKDYLEGFLTQKPAELSGEEPGGALYEAVIDALKDIYDPEIPVNIYDLGLVYGVEISAVTRS